MNELLVARERPESAAIDEVACGFIGQAPGFREVLAKLPKLASADAAVLISGETGTGKELVARAIHGMSRRTTSPFVAVNCGSLIDTLFESEVFGHERGAFTDAHARRQGLMAQATGDTLFLDEADTLTPRGQVALLRALQDRSFRPLGSTSEHRVDVRFLAATNARLDRMVESGSWATCGSWRARSCGPSRSRGTASSPPSISASRVWSAARAPRSPPGRRAPSRPRSGGSSRFSSAST